MHSIFNPLNPELYPICHLLTLLGAHHILHVGRIRVNMQLCLKKTPTYVSASRHQILLYQSYMHVTSV
jgi:hypothetical protein